MKCQNKVNNLTKKSPTKKTIWFFFLEMTLLLDALFFKTYKKLSRDIALLMRDLAHVIPIGFGFLHHDQFQARLEITFNIECVTSKNVAVIIC